MLVGATLCGAAAVAAAVLAAGWRSGDELVSPLLVNLALSVLAGLATSHMSLAAAPLFVKARLYGIDLNKPQTKRDKDGVLVRPYDGPIVPEAMGAVACTVYLVCMFAFLPFPFLDGVAGWGASVGGSWRVAGDAGGAPAQPSTAYHFPHTHLTKFLCALLAICCMCFLGFADNVLDLR